MFTEHLLGDRKAPFAPIAKHIAHKHVSLGITAEQYTIVGRHLLGAVREVLGQAVTDEAHAAWDEVYWLLACQLIAAEARLYQQGDIDPAQPWRPWRVAKRIDDADDAATFTLVPDDDGPVPDFRPGQYVSVMVTLPDGRRQPRQYSLSQGPGRGSLRITVRRVRGENGAPDGEVSDRLHEHVHTDDVLLLGPPAGDLTLDSGDVPVVLVSGGCQPIASTPRSSGPECSTPRRCPRSRTGRLVTVRRRVRRRIQQRQHRLPPGCGRRWCRGPGSTPGPARCASRRSGCRPARSPSPGSARGGLRGHRVLLA
ncbi:hypothetical protein PA7_03540 [Pseudonocardia asaccharolytica DSM 44247 = NBRC 16224]|uniref:nitric oxide dioxygenase n=1 Tax=Pseudonocardia asaccharolytica DSM 44247 = NBRC 16224 TaxID=1123024 RepID=A0A511CVN1_9PSEU|nr:hypothetical protein PA7_03540 [Pseudonocardia asaccharolytica DSM 44247 = NBRC 16224]